MTARREWLHRIVSGDGSRNARGITPAREWNSGLSARPASQILGTCNKEDATQGLLIWVPVTGVLGLDRRDVDGVARDLGQIVTRTPRTLDR